jgi:cellulose synthase/poly-beta-1,6-N-acetylglucosamine synthase-like glycosyltransferase
LVPSAQQSSVPALLRMVGHGALGGRSPGPPFPSHRAPCPPRLPVRELSVVLLTAYAVLTLLFLAVASTTLVWMLHAWQSPDALEGTRFPAGGPVADIAFSLIVPARHEETVLGGTLDRLAALRYDRFEVLTVVGHDDPGTAEVARAAAERHPGRVRVLVDTNWPKNKPKALNTALPACRGDIIGVTSSRAPSSS